MRVPSLLALAVTALLGLTLGSEAQANDRLRPGANPPIGPRVPPARPGPRTGPTVPAPDLEDREARKDHLDRVAPGAEVPADGGPGREVPVPTIRRDGALAGMHRGHVRIVGDLARVDLTLQVTNRSPELVEWRETYAIDPAAELIGAVLKRPGNPATDAQTLFLATARQIYDEVVASYRPPPSPTTPGRVRDPLRIERQRSDRLAISLFPVASGETVTIELTFITPLKGRGARRTYEDPIGGAASRFSEPEAAPAPSPTPPATPRPDTTVSDRVEWVVQATGLVLDAEPEGMALKEEGADGRLRFEGTLQTGANARRPAIPFLVPAPDRMALAAREGGLGTRTALFHFDPQAFLVERDFEAARHLHVELRPVQGGAQRIAPHHFEGHGAARPVGARIRTHADTVRLEAVVVDAEGRIIHREALAIPVRSGRLDRVAEGAITGYHRAAVARRVLRWAHVEAAPKGRVRALALATRYAVDAGVLVFGTAALAIPPADLRRVSRASRRLYKEQGAPLGAQRREATFVSPPREAFGD